MHLNWNGRAGGDTCHLLTVGNYDGIQVFHLLDWLTEKKEPALPEF
jgi:hypothetical protein